MGLMNTRLRDYVHIPTYLVFATIFTGFVLISSISNLLADRTWMIFDAAHGALGAAIGFSLIWGIIRFYKFRMNAQLMEDLEYLHNIDYRNFFFNFSVVFTMVALIDSGFNTFIYDDWGFLNTSIPLILGLLAAGSFAIMRHQQSDEEPLSH